MEHDPKMPEAEKTVAMLTWWHDKMELYATLNLPRESFIDMSLSGKVLFRNGISEFMQLSAKL